MNTTATTHRAGTRKSSDNTINASISKTKLYVIYFIRCLIYNFSSYLWSDHPAGCQFQIISIYREPCSIYRRVNDRSFPYTASYHDSPPPPPIFFLFIVSSTHTLHTPQRSVPIILHNNSMRRHTAAHRTMLHHTPSCPGI